MPEQARAAGAAINSSRRVLGNGLNPHRRLLQGELPRDGRDLGVPEEPFVVLDFPVEEHPYPVGVIGIPEDMGNRAPVLLPLLSALRREGLQELVEVVDLATVMIMASRLGEPLHTDRMDEASPPSDGLPPRRPYRRPVTQSMTPRSPAS